MFLCSKCGLLIGEYDTPLLPSRPCAACVELDEERQEEGLRPEESWFWYEDLI